MFSVVQKSQRTALSVCTYFLIFPWLFLRLCTYVLSNMVLVLRSVPISDLCLLQFNSLELPLLEGPKEEELDVSQQLQDEETPVKETSQVMYVRMYIQHVKILNCSKRLVYVHVHYVASPPPSRLNPYVRT